MTRSTHRSATQSAVLAFAAAVTLAAAGCSTFDLGARRDFEDWLVGDPARDYDDFGAEQSPTWIRITYGLFLGTGYALRDLTKIVMIPVTLPYYALGDGSSGSGGAETPGGPDR